jgi:predicted cupin superfamily sugar epimerase
MELHAAQLIESLQLEPHPEGGYYRELHRSSSTVQPEDGRGKRSAITTIYFLLTRGQTSALHLVSSDEVWHHLEGAPLELIISDREFMETERFTIGALRDGMEPEFVVEANDWQAARSTGEWSLVACTVGPGFDFADFIMLRNRPEEVERCRERLPELIELV